MPDNPIARIPDAELTYRFAQKGAIQAELERQWAIVENQRLPVLAEITSWYEGSRVAAEEKARVSREYQEFLTHMGEVKKQLVEARNKTKALDLEIRLRINKRFADRSELNGGNIQT